MAKQSAFLKKLYDQFEREKQEAELATLRFTRQIVLDCTAIALNDVCGFGADRIKKVIDAIAENYADYADMINEDTEDQDYSWTKLDQRLKQICGEYFVPFEERYK